jgi:DNA-binding CsgD family transcriptional regulator
MKYFGRWRGSLPIAAEMRVRAISAGLRSWEMMFVWHELVTLIDCAGELERAVRIGLALIDDVATPARLRQDAAGVTSLALFDLGHRGDAADLLRQTEPSEPQESTFPYLAQAELELASGSPRSAIATVDQACAGLPDDVNLVILWATRCWAQLELGESVAPFAGRAPPLCDSYLAEIRGLVALRDDDHTSAARSFDEASRLARDWDIRTELRCAWASAVAEGRAGATGRAAERLMVVERRAAALGMEHLLTKVRRSLRDVGIRRSAGRTRRIAGLSGRERLILELVAQGDRTRDIAARLGIAASTVDSAVKSAMTKLDAHTRIEAAQRYAELETIDI